MPIKEEDPWRMQYFEHAACPENVWIPTEDGDAYLWYPEHRWVYNKMLVCETQDIPHAPHGIAPKSFPVFSKPIYNMRGMSTGSRIFRSIKEYRQFQAPGHFWMALMEGEHISTDVALVQGEPVWWRHVTGIELEGGMFDYWTVHRESRPDLEAYCSNWLRTNLASYTGMVNLETIGGRIIEAHLRFADQWPDLYGKGWIDALVGLYEKGEWTYDDNNRQPGYSVVLFGGHGLRFRHPEPGRVEEIRSRPHISSVQITFHEDRPPGNHAMPPGGFRLAIVNSTDLDAGLTARQDLALSFWSTQKLYGRRRRTIPSNQTA